MDVKELKKGDVFYVIEDYHIVKYTYIGKYPDGSDQSIIVDDKSNAFVVGNLNLSDVMETCVFSYKEALDQLLAEHEDAVENVKRRIDQMEGKEIPKQ